jgi:hypothetical protein
MRKTLLCFACLLLALPGHPCWGQFIRVPVIRVPVVRAPVIPHVPVHVPGQSQAGEKSWEEILPWAGGALAVVAGAGGGWYLVSKWRTKAAPRAVIRIRALPPGDPPEWVRAAWVGLELPLIVGQVRPEEGPAQQAVSRQQVNVPEGYAVDGKTAVETLESASSEAASWWRSNAPDVLAPGYQLVFPAHVCERLDDLGQPRA